MKFKFAKKEFSFSFLGFLFKFSGNRPVSIVQSLLDCTFQEIKKKRKESLNCRRRSLQQQTMRSIVHEFQILIRNHYPVFLVMAGLYENVRNLLDAHTLTFLYRAPITILGPLRLADIADSFHRLLRTDFGESVKLSKLTNGYAFAFQTLGYTFSRTTKKTADEDILNDYDRRLEEYVYAKIYSDASLMEKNVMISLQESADGSVKDEMEKAKMNSSTFSSYRKNLIKKGIVFAPSYGHLAFPLPRFSLFVRRAVIFS